MSHFRPAVVEGIADRAAIEDLAQADCRFNEIRLLLGIGARTLIAARQGFTDVNNDMVAVTGTVTCASALEHVPIRVEPYPALRK
ncbi:MAG: hypothetical protein M3178_03915 [Pseudomonadota bacterium]|nr:hypothetical protein [Pseudomonadota bacterium]